MGIVNRAAETVQFSKVLPEAVCTAASPTPLISICAWVFEIDLLFTLTH